MSNIEIYKLLKMVSEVLWFLTPIFYNIQFILFGFILLLNVIFPIKYQTLSNNELNLLSSNCKIIKTYKDTSITFGLFFTYYPYISFGIISNDKSKSKDIEINIFCFEILLNRIENNFDKAMEQKKNNIYSLTPKFNAFWCCAWNKERIKLQSFPEKTDHQINCLKYLKDNINKNLVILIHGIPKTGKSSVGLIHAKELIEDGYDVYLTNDYRPTDLGTLSGFQTLYSTFNNECNSNKKRLIVLIDEIDVHLNKIEQSDYKDHNEYKREVSNKSEWNIWIDKLHTYRYENITFIMTSNKSKDYFNGGNIFEKGIDPSLVRSGRINKKFCFTKELIITSEENLE